MFAKVEVDSSLLIEEDENKLCDCLIRNGKKCKNAKKAPKNILYSSYEIVELFLVDFFCKAADVKS
jgi:hypothetical protein